MPSTCQLIPLAILCDTFDGIKEIIVEQVIMLPLSRSAAIICLSHKIRVGKKAYIPVFVIWLVGKVQ